MSASHAKVPDTRLETITPEVARRYLGLLLANRNVRDRVVNKYARDMLAGDWKANGETIKFNADGKLIDGQHRLAAIIQANIPIQSMVTRNVPNDAMKTIDTGAPRLFSDVVAMGGSKNSMTIAAAARWWAKYEGGPGKTIMISHSELETILDAHPSLITGAAATVRHAEAKRLVPASILAFVYARVYEHDPDAADLFLDSLATGEGLKDGDPVFALRRALVFNATRKRKLPPPDLLAMVIKTFNYTFEGQRVQNIVYRRTTSEMSGEEFPKFVFEQAPSKRVRGQRNAKLRAVRQPILVDA